MTLLVKCVDFAQGSNAFYHWKTLMNFLSMHLKLVFCQKLIWRNAEGMEKNELISIAEEMTITLKESNLTKIYCTEDTTVKTSEKLKLNSVTTKGNLEIGRTFTTTVPSIGLTNSFNIVELGLGIWFLLVLVLLVYFNL